MEEMDEAKDERKGDEKEKIRKEGRINEPKDEK